VRYLDHDKDVKITMNPFLKDEVIELKDKVKLLLSSKTPPKRCLNQNKCNSCNLKDRCIKL